MRSAVAAACGVFIACAAAKVCAAGNLQIEFAGIAPGKLKHVRVEVLRLEGKKARVAFRNDAAKIPRDGLSLPPGDYQVYLEDKETGLIVPLDAAGPGLRVRAQGVVRADANDFDRKAQEIKDRNRAERSVKIERLQRHQGRRAVFAAAGEPAAGDEPQAGPEDVREQDYAPGELLIKYQPETTLADRYRFIRELKAENRSKLDQLDVYRVRVDEATAVPEAIQRLAADPRIKYLELNMVVGVPDPVESGGSGR